MYSPNFQRSGIIAAWRFVAWAFLSLGLLAACGGPAPTPNSEQIAPLNPGDPARISIQPPQQEVRVGEVFTVTVLAENAANVAGAEVHLAFNSNFLEVVDGDSSVNGVQVSNGTLLTADFIAVNVADNDAGTIDFAVVQLNRPPAKASGSLAIIQFRGKAPGTSVITFLGIQSAPTGVNLADDQGRGLVATEIDGEVTVRGD